MKQGVIEMPWRQRIWNLIGLPVGVSLINGRHISGVLCRVRDRQIFIIQFNNQGQYGLRSFNFNQILNVTEFPSCRTFFRDYAIENELQEIEDS